jgi:hypothetical protein
MKMKVKRKAKNDENNPETEGLTDLQVTDEQADETKGGAGSRDAHWRESTFGNELMTG